MESISSDYATDKAIIEGSLRRTEKEIIRLEQIRERTDDEESELQKLRNIKSDLEAQWKELFG